MFHGAIQKIKLACFMDCSVEGNTFLHSSISSGNNKEYLTAVFKY